MENFKDPDILITTPHECPYKDDIIAKKFGCDNLKLKKGEFYCIVCRCPYNNEEYPQEYIKPKY